MVPPLGYRSRCGAAVAMGWVHTGPLRGADPFGGGHIGLRGEWCPSAMVAHGALGRHAQPCWRSDQCDGAQGASTGLHYGRSRSCHRWRMAKRPKTNSFFKLQIEHTNTSKTLGQLECDERRKFSSRLLCSKTFFGAFGAKTPANNGQDVCGSRKPGGEGGGVRPG